MAGKDQSGPKRLPPPISFSSITSAKLEIKPKSCLIFSFNPFPTLSLSFKFIPSASPKLLNFNQDHTSKKRIFLKRIIT